MKRKRWVAAHQRQYNLQSDCYRLRCLCQLVEAINIRISVLLEMLKMTVRQANLIKAAFIILYEATFAGLSSTVWRDLQDCVDTLRRLIPLSRKEAQHILADSSAIQSEFLPAALVLTYEGTNAYRVEPDFTFQQEDIVLLTTARQRARMSAKRAIALLYAYQQQSLPTSSAGNSRNLRSGY